MSSIYPRTMSVTLAAASLVGGFGGAARAEGNGAADAQAETTKAEMTKAVGFVPSFMKSVPANALPGTWRETRDFELGKTALDAKTKDLIGLAIAAQLPSRLTAWSYALCAKASGASEAEVHEAVVISAMARHWSTFFNGIQLDEARYRADLGKFRENITKAMSSGAKAPAPLPITDAASVYKDVEASFGFVPDFLKHVPAEALPGAWLNFRNVLTSETTAIPGKTKNLVSLAVASQIPCRYCIISDTEIAKLQGASDREIAEAVMEGAMARQYITLVEGLQVDEKSYRRDWERLTAGATKNGAPHPRSAAAGSKKGTHLAKSE
jgi:AhpD family alkylhydroperoxidase